MFPKTILLAVAAVASVASAANPGCLLGAVNSYSTPGDIKSVCGEKDIAQVVSKKCGAQTKEALAALADVCNGAGVDVCMYTLITSFPFYPSICLKR